MTQKNRLPEGGRVDRARPLNFLFNGRRYTGFAGDTLEDTVTYISEPEHIETHVAELDRMATWPIQKILPNHGDPGRIAAGGYDKTLIAANCDYLERLLDPEEASRARTQSLFDFVERDIASGAILYFAPYEAVHRENVAAVSRQPVDD